jgi:GNAT superfamily N-acetyltransferase
MADQHRVGISMTECVDRVVEYQQRWREDGIGRWAIRSNDGDALVGWAGFTRATAVGRPNDFELGARLAPEVQGAGVASELQQLCLKYAYGTRGLDLTLAFHNPHHYGTNDDGTSHIPKYLSPYTHLGSVLTTFGSEVELYELTAERFFEPLQETSRGATPVQDLSKTDRGLE